MGQVQKEQSHETSNATGFSQMNVRLQSIESQLERLERKMDTHQEYIQELWLNQAPVPDISCPGPQTPVVRLQDHDLNDDDLFGAPDPTEGSQSQADDLESRSLRTKDLHHLKLPNLPDSASHFRSWKNAVRTVLLSFDHSQEGHLTPWLNQAFQLRGQEAERLKLSSDSFPRMDRVLASVLCRQEVLKTSFGLRIQSYVESCESEGIQVRGRFIINLISKEFDTSVASGAITSSLELFQLPIPQDSAAALKQWRDKAVYILSQLSAAQRPGEELMSQWIYTTLKKHPLMRRVMDRYLDSPLGSSERSFATMWDGVERALLEAQHDANAQSIRDDLKRGPMVGKKPALPGHKGDGKSKDSPKHAKQDGKDKPSGKGQGSGNRASTSPDKRKKASTSAKEQGKGKAAKVPTAEEKAKSPCIYHVKGRCMRGDSCPYDHTSSAPQPKAKASSSGPGLVAKAAAVAIVATPSAATAVPSTSTMCLDVVGDTGAGENLASIEALRRQGLDVGSFITQASHPVRFLTGGGQRTGESTLGFWSDEFQRLSNFYLLPQCPVALSIGQLVETDGYSFVWHPNKLPMLIPPSTSFDYQLDGPVICADRIEHHVPMFRLTVECTYGLPASSSDVPFGGGDGDEASGDAVEFVADPLPEPISDLDSPDIDAIILGDDPVPGAGRPKEDPASGAGKEIGEEGPDRREIKWEEEVVTGIPSNHLMTHLPKSRDCDTCKRAKLYEFQHRRSENQSQNLKDIRLLEAPTFFLEKVAVDHMIVRDEIGYHGETCAFVMVDVFSGFTSMAPCQHKSAEEVELSLRRFCGKKKPGIVQVSSDRAPEIKKALFDLGFASEPSAPYQKIKNALAESTIRTIKGMASSILTHAGLDLQYWPLALKYLEWAYNVTAPAKEVDEDGEAEALTKYAKAMRYSIECFMIPFGALVWYKVPNPYSFGPKGEPALFLGAELTDGMLFKGNYRVWPLEHFQQGVLKEFVTSTIAIPNEVWQFPASGPTETPELDGRAEEELDQFSYEKPPRVNLNKRSSRMR